MTLVNDWDKASRPSAWICSSCVQAIEEADHGLLEWLAFPLDDDGKRSKPSTRMRIVHERAYSPNRRGCQFTPRDCDREGTEHCEGALAKFLGPDGLMMPLEMQADGEVDRAPLREIIKRLHMPRYEQARLHFDAAIREGVLEPAGVPEYYSQSEMEAVLEWQGELEG